MAKQQQMTTKRAAAFFGREHEAPVKPLVRTRSHTLEPGMVCEHISVIDERWVVESVNGFWARASKGRGQDVITQSFPVDSLLPVIEVVKGKREPRVKVKSDTVPSKRSTRTPSQGLDDVALRLKEADTLDQMWGLAIKMGLPADLRAKLAHLNPGLQRMNIGNWLRAKAKKAQKND